MSFVYPNFLWALLVLLIPIIVHLFNFRRYKTIYFSRVNHLREVIEDTKAGTKLKHYLVLLSRLLLLTCLVLAFAQPYIPNDAGEAQENLTGIYIDNTYSMQAEGQDGDLLNEVKNQAISLVSSLPDNEKITLLTADLLSIHQRFYTKADVLEMIKNITYSAKSTALTDAISLQNDVLNQAEKEGNKRIFMLSDFQESTSDLAEMEAPNYPVYYYQASPENAQNIYIDSVWFESPVHRIDQPVDVHFRIQNQGETAANDLSIRLEINGNEPGPKRVSIPANGMLEDKITFTDRSPGIKKAKLQIETDQLFFDDEFFFTYTIKEQVSILLINGDNTSKNNLSQLYSLDDYYAADERTLNQVVPEDFDEKELIIVQNVNTIPSGIMDLLDDALSNGGTVVLIPGTAIETTDWNTYLTRHQLPTYGRLDSVNTSLSYFNDADPLYSGVFSQKPENYVYPKIFKRYNVSVNNRQNFITLFGTSPERPFLLYSSSKNGRIVQMTAPLTNDFTNFQNHALFAATFLRIAETSTFQKPLYMTIGKMENFSLQEAVSEKNPIHLKNEAYKVDVIPMLINVANSRAISFSHLENTIAQSGFYTLTDNEDFNEVVALNYNRKESDIQSFTTDELKENFEKIGWNNAEPLSLTESGTVQINQLKAQEYWRILLILALIFLGIEILLLKFLKG